MEKSRSGFSEGNLGVFKKRNYKYFEYKKVNLVWYYNSIEKKTNKQKKNIPWY